MQSSDVFQQIQNLKLCTLWESNSSQTSATETQ